LSLIFLIIGRSEEAAFIAARLFFAAAIAVIYHIARETFDRRRAVLSAVLFGAAPVCFWFSASTGTDIPAALASALGLWGLQAGNGMLAAAGFALAAQMRLELIVLIPPSGSRGISLRAGNGWPRPWSWWRSSISVG
jgi:4-amino-4-deoxy-L-arabinose transferase-like glycosyltransferase